MKQLDVVVPDGSMQEVVSGLFTKAGLPIIVEKKRTKQGKVMVPWISRVVFQRPQEIPQYLNNGHFDVAIVGQDWIANWGYDFPVLLKLPIGRSCERPVRIVLAVEMKNTLRDIGNFPVGCEVATEYVQLTQRFFAEWGRPDICVIPSYGNTEQKIKFGATAIVDVVESGESLRENGLEIIYKIMESSTVIVANPESLADTEKKPLIDCFVRLINGAYQASKYVMLTVNVPEKSLSKAAEIIGGLKGPTVSPLFTGGWFAMQSIIGKADEQDVIFRLLQIGVTDIIVTREIPLIMS